MLLPPPIPLVSLHERELGLPEFARRYSAAIGESVEVLPTVERRAIAVFVRNRPWDEVLALAGRAAGFRIVRERGRLRMKSARSFTPTEIETRRNVAARKRLTLPASVREAFEARASLLTEDDDGPDWEEADRLYASVAGPAQLVAARLLARGVRFPLGRTVEYDDVPYTHADDLVFGAAKELPGFTRVRGAFKLKDDSLSCALEFSDGERTFAPWRSSVDLEESDSEAQSPSEKLIASVPWSASPEPTICDATIGDVLEWWHRCTGETTVGPALRIALQPGPPYQNSPFITSGPEDSELPTSALGEGFTFSRQGKGIVAENDWGDGLWPSDFTLIERSERPNLATFLVFARTERDLWTYLSSGYWNRVLVRTMPGSCRLWWSGLRTLAEMSPDDARTVLSARSTEVSTTDPRTIRAIERHLYNDEPGFLPRGEEAWRSIRVRSMRVKGGVRHGDGWRAFDPQGHAWDQWVLSERPSEGESFVRWRDVPIPFETRRRIAVESFSFEVLASDDHTDTAYAPAEKLEIVRATGPIVPITKKPGG